jgi:hypothetical protein
MPQRVVDWFEPIQIEKQDPDLVAVTFGQRDRVIEAVNQ